VCSIFSSTAAGYIVGNGENTDFWTANWTGKRCFAWRWPILHSLSVAKALCNNRWVCGLQGALSNEAMGEFFQLWNEIRDVLLLPSADEIRWKLTNDGQFSVAENCPMTCSSCNRELSLWRAAIALQGHLPSPLLHVDCAKGSVSYC
jgi:hypothetical protein